MTEDNTKWVTTDMDREQDRTAVCLIITVWAVCLPVTLPALLYTAAAGAVVGQCRPYLAASLYRQTIHLRYPSCIDCERETEVGGLTTAVFIREVGAVDLTVTHLRLRYTFQSIGAAVLTTLTGHCYFISL